MKKILFFCPLPNPITGQSLISDIVYKEIKPRYLINYSITMRSKILGSIWIIFKIIYYAIFVNVDTIYFTCTRSKIGAIKDVILINLFKLRKVEIINHLHGNDLPNLFESGFLKKLITGAYNKIDKTIILFEGQREQLKDFRNMKIEVVKNCYDQKLDEVALSETENDDFIHILYLSNIMVSKGIFYYLHAIETIASESENTIFHIAGAFLDDEYMGKNEVKNNFNTILEILHEKFGDRIFYHGVVSGKSKVDLLNISDIFVLPTFYKTEAFPISILEALRMGNFVITTKHNFLPELISEKEGILIDKENQQILNDAIIKAVVDVDLRKTIQNRNITIAKDLYSPSVFKQRIREIILD